METNIAASTVLRAIDGCRRAQRETILIGARRSPITHLYTNETFSPLKPDGLQQAAEPKAAGGVVGANLMPENVALPDLRFTSAFMLSCFHGGSPMGLLAYVEPLGAPILLCILANGA
jgi:hypothetical protein